MKSEWCQQEAKRYADRCRELAEDGKYAWWARLAEMLDGHSQALLQAEQRGRREGMEEAAKVAEGYADFSMSAHLTKQAKFATDVAARSIASEIRAKLEEVQK